jgi:zinc transport system permease protein
MVGCSGLFVLVAVVWCYRGLVFAGFDPEGARVQRLPVRSLELLLWFLVALEVSVATRAIGALPVFAFAVLPAMAALALLERLRYALVAAALVGGTAGGGGYLLAFFMEFPVGACQAALATLAFVAAAVVGRLRSVARG